MPTEDEDIPKDSKDVPQSLAPYHRFRGIKKAYRRMTAIILWVVGIVATSAVFKDNLATLFAGLGSPPIVLKAENLSNVAPDGTTFVHGWEVSLAPTDSSLTVQQLEIKFPTQLNVGDLTIYSASKISLYPALDKIEMELFHRAGAHIPKPDTSKLLFTACTVTVPIAVTTNFIDKDSAKDVNRSVYEMYVVGGGGHSYAKSLVFSRAIGLFQNVQGAIDSEFEKAPLECRWVPIFPDPD